MDEFETLDTKLEDRSKRCKEIMDGIAGWVKVTPYIQQLKDETDTRRALLNALPRDITKSTLNEKLKDENEEDKILKPFLSDIPPVDKLFVVAVEGTAGSSTGYVVMATNAILEYEGSTDSDYDWVKPVQNIVDDHTNKVQQRTNIPERLNILNFDLGAAYKVV